MKILSIIIICLFFFNTSYGQEKYLTTKGYVSFFSHTILEDIDANNKQAMSIIDVATKDIEIHTLMKSFTFENSLMQEHFNENYMESDKFPKSIFKGKVLNFDVENSLEQKVSITGELSLHGVTKPIKTEALVVFAKDKLTVKGSFNVLIADYDIEVPSLLTKNIAESIKISFDLNHEPYKK